MKLLIIFAAFLPTMIHCGPLKDCDKFDMAISCHDVNNTESLDSLKPLIKGLLGKFPLRQGGVHTSLLLNGRVRIGLHHLFSLGEMADAVDGLSIGGDTDGGFFQSGGDYLSQHGRDGVPHINVPLTMAPSEISPYRYLHGNDKPLHGIQIGVLDEISQIFSLGVDVQLLRLSQTLDQLLSTVQDEYISATIQQLTDAIKSRACENVTSENVTINENVTEGSVTTETPVMIPAECRPCPRFQISDHLRVMYSPVEHGDILEGTNATFSCENEYTSSQDGVVSVCQNDGTWSNSAPTCVPELCPRIKMYKGRININGQYQGSHSGPANIGDTATYYCNHRFHLVGNNDNNTCLPGGVWEHEHPVCIRNGSSVSSCPYMDLRGGHIRGMSSRATTSRLLDLRCKHGFAFSGPDESAHSVWMACLEGGQYNRTLPTCVCARCPKVKLPKGRVNYSPENRLVGATATFQCRDGYKLQPADRTHLTCQLGGLWSRDIPMCVRDICNWIPSQETIPSVHQDDDDDDNERDDNTGREFETIDTVLVNVPP